MGPSIYWPPLGKLTLHSGGVALDLGSTDQGDQFHELIISQCLNVKFLRVESVGFVLVISCSFCQKKLFLIFYFFEHFKQKCGIFV